MMSMSAPGAGMGYPGYHHPPPGPGFGFPSQPMMPYSGATSSGFPMTPHQPYGFSPPGMGMMPSVAPPAKKPDGTQVCTVHPPGMPRAFDVPFPERKLPVCIRCKKNYRSRELCRQRDEHKALPWQTTYVVVTLTDAVLEKGEDGNLSVADIPMIAELQDMPELCRGPADGFMQKEPICKVCKEKNYTRDYCRNTSKHTTPPYQAVYVKLVAKQSDDDDHLRPAKRKKRKPEENADGKPRPDPDNPDEATAEFESDDLTEIHKSKTFFAAISSKKITVKWCEHILYPEVAEIPQQPSAPQQMNMGNAPNMQGQLWDAFRAGAMWAQSHGGQMQMPGGQMMGQIPTPGYGHPPNPNPKPTV